MTTIPLADDEAMRIAGTSRLEQFRTAQTLARAVEAAARTAVPAEKAAKWLHEYGPNCRGTDAATVRWTPAFAGSCAGAGEAGEYIVKAIFQMLPMIVAEAQDLAEADMAKLMEIFGGLLQPGGPA